MSATPIGDAAREATASPYIGRHRRTGTGWPPGPRRCQDCGHIPDMCYCTCCEAWGDDE